MATRGISIPLEIGASILPNVGRTGNNTAGEDMPSGPSPARISRIRNVLPTELGYKSAFGPAFPDCHYISGNDWPKFVFSNPDNPSDVKAINRDLLKGLFVQHVVAYETGNADLLYFILCESGVWAHRPSYHDEWFTDGQSGKTDKFLEFEPVYLIAPEQGRFNLWTYCTLDNRLYLYRQGMDEVIVIGDLTLSTDLKNWKQPYTELFRKEDHFIEAVTSQPSFLNMEGQIGVFKAGNRLGFWDSDNAVAWSSVYDKLDFTPDVVSMAGITKFADFQGDIVMILPTADGFVVYLTGAIVRVDPLLNSEERWGATTILKGHGIAFYTHVTVGSDPEYHVAWTNAGLFEIRGRQIQPLLMEEYRWLKEEDPNSGNIPAIHLKLIGAEYLIISRATYWDAYPANTYLRQGLLEGEDGDYSFYLPNEPSGPEWKPGLFDVIQGRLPDVLPKKFDKANWEKEEDFPSPKDVIPLIPCYTGFKFTKPTNWHLLKFEKQQSTRIPYPRFESFNYPGIWAEPFEEYYNVAADDFLPNPLYTDPFLYVHEVSPNYEWSVIASREGFRRFIDKAGEEFIELLHESAQIYSECLAEIWDTSEATDYPLTEISRAYNPLDTFGRPATSEVGGGLGLYFQGFNKTQYQTEKERPSGAFDPETGDPIMESTAPESTHFKEPAPRTEEELEANEFLTESEFEALKPFYWPASDLPYPNMHRIHSANVGKVPWNKLPIKVVQDSCSIRLMVFVDYMASTGVYYMEPSLWEEADAYPDSWACSGKPADKVYWAVTHLTCEADFELPWRNLFWGRKVEVFPQSFINKSREEINALCNPTNEEIDLIPQWVPIFQAEVSGLGYIKPPFSFRKTISKARLWMNSGDECVYKTPPVMWDYDPNDDASDKSWSDSWDSGPDHLGHPPTTTWPPEDDSLPEPPEFVWPFDVHYAAKFRQGTRAPYYPIYERAFIWDRILGKWGSMDHPHGLVFTVAAENSNFTQPQTMARLMPFGILPKFPVPSLSDDPDYTPGIYELWVNSYARLSNYDDAFLERHQLPTFLSSTGEAGQLWIDSIALTRDGRTKMVGLSGDKAGVLSVEVRASHHGAAFPLAGNDGNWYPDNGHWLVNQANNLSLAYWQNSSGLAREPGEFRMPFVLTGKEFQIAIRGQFNLHKLICYGQETSKIDFFGRNNYPAGE